jgi:hypothetical protein
LLTDEERSHLIAFIGLTPDAGDIIPDTGGVRKLRGQARAKGSAAVYE